MCPLPGSPHLHTQPEPKQKHASAQGKVTFLTDRTIALRAALPLRMGPRVEEEEEEDKTLVIFNQSPRQCIPSHHIGEANGRGPCGSNLQRMPGSAP